MARQNMPVSSIVVGIDLFPIKPIQGCIGLVEDITTEKCRVALTKELQTWKADVVLNDGAPNVGKNWLFDAYQQACLTLSALKLATQFLKKGGWFVTKVFRSKDYQPLMWVFKQLFKKVHATKPQASRNESAEIFVVCQYYMAPDKLDPKFMDPKYVFEELDIEPKNKLNILHPEKTKKSKVEGYEDNNYTMTNKLPVSEFVKHPNGIGALEVATQIVFDDDRIANHKSTTNEIKECCKDIKVLGRKDLRQLLAWWKIMNAEFVKPEKEEEEVDEIEESAEEEEDEETQIDNHISELQDEEKKEMKRKKKKALKERKKLNEKLNLKMVLKGDEGPTMEGDEMFNLKMVKSSKDMEKLLDQDPNIVAKEEIDYVAQAKYERYQKGESHLDSSGLYYKDSDSELEMESGNEDDDEVIKEGLGFSDDDDDEKDDESPKKKKKQEKNPLITDLDNRNKEQKRISKAEMFFERDIFKNLISEKDEDADLDKLAELYKSKGMKVREEVKAKEIVKKEVSKYESDSDYSTDEDSSDSDESDYDFDQIKKKHSAKKQEEEKDGFEVVKSTPIKGKRKLTVEELALGTVLVNSKKAKRDMIDAAWNRYTFNDKNLPDWFVDDENKHMKKEANVPKELVDDYKKRLEEINVRPIKKVIEAKARKKRRTLKKLEKAKKKVEALIDNNDVDDREKAKQIKQLYKKAHRTTKEEVTYVVAKKHSAGKRVARPAGIKGPYKVVDPRMRKDSRNDRIRSKRSKKKTKGPKPKAAQSKNKKK